MKREEIIEIFKKTGALRQGHFRLTSGLHSGAYIQCALILQDPVISSRLCGYLAQKFMSDDPDMIIGPAMGGIVFAYEMARALGAKAMFTERNSDGKMSLRRGFVVSPESRVIIAEDVLTTGGSVKEVIDLLEKDGVQPRAVACLVDRSGSRLDFGGIKHESLIKLNVPVFEEANCPLCEEGIPLVKPGSRRV